ncbi:hypothetical protein BofuT4_uP080160.1 [Botrytis cinerea T4]|uniref:Uncharacterized protein n=1 Tax=Botryotinia fuckeliana (strain T4) TaxID=999810 RepID=G2YKS3_BOTF4|nr:hypothetical protein BofuT4_uP080160.1 [Botrytis cinerea T4]
MDDFGLNKTRPQIAWFRAGYGGRQMNDRHVYLHSNADDDDMDDDEIQSRILIAFVSSPALQCLGLQCLVVSGLQSLVSSLRL